MTFLHKHLTFLLSKTAAELGVLLSSESHDQDHGYKVKRLRGGKGLIKIECDPPGKKVFQLQCNVCSPEGVWELLQFSVPCLKAPATPQ